MAVRFTFTDGDTLVFNVKSMAEAWELARVSFPGLVVKIQQA